jgi:flavin-dependent dehydrogenase
MLEVDVAVIGGGFAGLCLARHLLRVRPGTTIALIDRGPLPRSSELRGVGESTSEIAAWYLAERLGLRELLEREQIVKYGLRFWLRGSGQRGGIDERVELGPMGPPPSMPELIPPLEPHAYQLHRGRIEASLDALLGDAVVRLANRAVLGLQAGEGGWRIELADEQVHARWVVDASGDGSLSREQLGASLHERHVDHRLSAAWWWVEGRIDPASWGQRASERTPKHLRWRSTHHLVGPGYWAWLIPLSDGSTSVGIVVDRVHAARHRLPLAELSADPSELGSELREHLHRLEPELTKQLAAFPSSPVVARHIAARAFSQPVQRGWLVTGAALAVLDALYSSGHDLMAIVHELAVPAIVADLDGHDPTPALAHANRSFAAILDHFAGIYVGNGDVLAQPLLAALSVEWEQAIYFGWLCPLLLGNVLSDHELARWLMPLGDRVHRLGTCVHELLRRWSARRTGGHAALALQPFVDQSHIGAVMRHFLALAPLIREPLAGDRLLEHLGRNVVELEKLALGLFELACTDLEIAPPSDAIDPYAISLDPQRWAADGLFSPRRARSFDPEVRRDLERVCIADRPRDR